MTEERTQRAPAVRLAYLVGQYPAINHTFVLREVRRLREMGFDLRVASVLVADRTLEEMTPDEYDEARRVFNIKTTNPLLIIGPHLKTLVAHPLRYLKMLALTLGRCAAVPRTATSTLMYFIEAVILGSWMREQGVSHVHSHFASSVALMASRIFPITMSLTIHGPAEFDDPVNFLLAEKLRASTFVCAISNYARSQLMRYSDYSDWSKIEVAPLGVDSSLYTPTPFRQVCGPYEIVFVGRLAPVKAPHVLLAAVELLVKAGRDVRLRLVGDGPLRRSLEHEAHARGLDTRVVFEGWLNQEQVREVYEKADVFALPSFAEGVPVVLMEAMACEIPAIATFVNGIPELIRHEVDGLLVAPSDAEQLSLAIARLIDEPALGYRLGAAGRKRVMEKYDLFRNTARLADIFTRHLAQHESVELSSAKRLVSSQVAASEIAVK